MSKPLIFSLAILLCLMAQAQIPNNVPTNGLIGYFDFNNNATDLVTSVIPDINTAIPTVDRFGRDSLAYNFNGSEIIMYTNPLTPLFTICNSAQVFTVNFWVNAASFEDEFIAGAFGWGYYIGLTPSGNIKLAYIYNGNWYNKITNVSIPLNTWKMVTICKSVSTISLYIDGQLDITAGCTTSGFNKNNCWFGGDYQDNNHFFNGDLDDFGIWDRVLIEQEITDLFSSCQLSSLVTSQPTNQFANSGSSAQFIVNTTYPNCCYQWQTVNGFGVQNLNNGGQYSGVTTNILTVANVTALNNNQPFRCVLTLEHCTDTSNVAMLSVITGISEQSLSNIEVYPNPASDFITISSNQSLSEQEYKIFDPSGKVLKSGVLQSNENQIDISNLSNGLYLLFVNGHPAQRFSVLRD